MTLTTDWLMSELSSNKPTPKKELDPRPLMIVVEDQFGSSGLEIFMEILVGFNSQTISSPWSAARQVDWKDQIELKGLFQSEGLQASYGKFIDQRFIDFLHRNFINIDKMHWRKFEHLTAEYLDREGYRVELGPGRGDDGVDVRAWKEGASGSPPLIIAQCKKQKRSVEKVVIKALYADLVAESATSGLVVTTSRLAPGAEDTRIARAYPIDVADRATLQKWLLAMRKPGVGGDLFSN